MSKIKIMVDKEVAVKVVSRKLMMVETLQDKVGFNGKELNFAVSDEIMTLPVDGDWQVEIEDEKDQKTFVFRRVLNEGSEGKVEE